MRMTTLVTETRFIQLRGLRFHIETAGPEDGPLVILLHGFPENWASWKEQIGPLANWGFRVVAPDQRGYNLTEKPEGVQNYQMNEMTEDVLSLIAHFGRERAVIVGHDWGGAVAWNLAIRHPQQVERLVILNIPHPAALRRALATPTTGQFLRSWYIAFFQTPGLPEWLLRRGRFAGMRAILQTSAQKDTFTRDDIQRYVEAWGQPGPGGQGSALTSMIDWYRALGSSLVSGGSSLLADSNQRVSAPTLILWGERDIALVPQMAQWSLEWCDQGRLIRFAEATHWVQHDEAVRVNARMLDFLENLL